MVIAVVLWFAYNRILLPMADRLEQVLPEPSHACITCASASLLPASSVPAAEGLQSGCGSGVLVVNIALATLQQGIEVFAACCDVVTFGSALALALTPLSSVSYSELVGKIMVASQVNPFRHYNPLLS